MYSGPGQVEVEPSCVLSAVPVLGDTGRQLGGAGRGGVTMFPARVTTVTSHRVTHHNITRHTAQTVITPSPTTPTLTCQHCFPATSKHNTLKIDSTESHNR